MKVERDDGKVQVPNEFLYGLGAKKLDPYEMLIYIYLASYCFGDKNVCWPSQSKIASDLGISPDTVKTKLRYMARRGIISRKNIPRGGSIKSTTYTLVEWDNLLIKPDWYDLRPIEREEREKKKAEKKGMPNHPCDGGVAKSPNVGMPNPSKMDGQTAKNKTIEEDEMNNTKFAADAAKPSASHEAPKEPNEKDFTGKNVPPAVSSFDNTHKPKDISRFEFPKATLKEIQEKIYFWFRKHDPLNVHKHKATLYQTAEEHLSLLIQGYSYLHSYWKDYGYGDRTLIMFLQNLGRFCGEIENMRHNEDFEWRCDNRKLLLREFIRDHGLFDVMNKSKMDMLENAIRKYQAGGRSFDFLEPQRRYLDNHKKLFAWKHVLKDDKWGGPFEPYELELLTEEAIFSRLRVGEQCAS